MASGAGLVRRLVDYLLPLRTMVFSTFSMVETKGVVKLSGLLFIIF